MKIDSAEFVRSAHQDADFPTDGLPQVAFVGRSNVGKSSLLNRLLGRKGLARTSSTPGRTRSVNYFLINRRFYFVDLPGYGYAKASKSDRRSWAELVERYLRQAAPAPLVRIVRPAPLVRIVQLVDAKVGATPLDAEAYAYLSSYEVGVTVAATKIDRVGRSRRVAALASIRDRLGSGVDPLPVSAVTGDGIKELWRVVDDTLRATAD